MNNLTLTAILHRLHRFKGFRYVSAAFDHFADHVVVVDIQARKGCRGHCSGCGEPGPTYDHLPQRSWRFVPLWGLVVFLRCALRRIDCPQCGPTVEKVPWATGKLRLADVFRLYLAKWARRLSWSEVAECFAVSWVDVYASVRWVVQYGLAHRSLTGILAIGVDEIQVAKSRFWTLVYQIDEGARRLLWIGQDRTCATFRKFFDQMGPAVCGGIRFVCSDLWAAYLRVVRERLPGVLHVLDRFHIRQLQSEAVDQVRRQESHALATAGLKPLLKRMRWTFLKNRRNWTGSERHRMRNLQGASLRTVRAFLLVEAFQHFWTYNSPTWAGKFLRGWCGRVARSRLKPLKKVAKTLQQHRELLLNYFRAKREYSGGVIEGLNNKAKLTLRKSYGFRTDQAREIALFHVLGKLPEPQFTHEFL